MKYKLDERFILTEDGEATTTASTAPAGASTGAGAGSKPTLDWASAFKAAKTATGLEAFWTKFYEETFDEPFRDKIRKEYHTLFNVANKYLGWTAESNPLIELFLKPESILDPGNGYSVNYFIRILEAEKQGLVDIADLKLNNEALGKYDILVNKNFRQLDTESIKAWLTLRREVLTDSKAENKPEIKGRLFANAYLLGGGETKEAEPVNVNSGPLADIKRATRKLSKFLGKELGGKASFSKEDMEKLLPGLSADAAEKYFYYCYDVFTAIQSSKVLELEGPEIAKALAQLQAGQTKPVPEDIKKQCRAKIGFATKKIDKVTAFSILYALAKQAGARDLPERKSKETEEAT